MIDAIMSNLTTITICVFTFLVGIGIGGAITDMIWRIKEEEAEDETIYKH